MKKTKAILVVLLAVVVACAGGFSGCSTPKENKTEIVNARRNHDGDVSLETHAGLYMQLFKDDYPEMAITKIRWQILPTGVETYIVEGIHENKKCIVKYLVGNQMILGRTERELQEEEVQGDTHIEKPLVLEQLLTFTELCEVVLAELGGEMAELRVVWKGEIPLAHCEARDKDLRAKVIVLNAITGEVLY